MNNNSKKEIEKQLEKNKFPMLGKSHDDPNKSYQYLVTMPIYNLSKEKLEELQKLRDIKTLELETLENKTPEQIWEEELDEFLEAYNKWWANILEEENDDPQPENTKKRNTKKTNTKKKK